jgi:nucleotide-binding universal stress UspA family protein
MQPRADLPVVVGVDGSPSSILALDMAATEAALRGLKLRIVYVQEPHDVWRTVGRRNHKVVDPEQLMVDVHDRVAERKPDLAVESRIVDGLPAVVLIKESREANITVIGHQGDGFLGRAAGLVCRRLTASGHGPVIVARGETPPREDALVVLGVDVDAPAPQAIEFAFAAAAARRAPIRAVYASCDPSPEQAAVRLAEELACWSNRYPDIKVECLTDHRLDPPAAILAASMQAGLIVVGPHDQTAPRRLILGPVGDTLIQHAPCPVAVVHA